MVNMPKDCWNLHYSTFIIFIYHYQDNWVWKWVSYWHAKSWDCLLNDETYPVLNRDNLTISIHMQLSQIKKTFAQFFAAFLKSTINFKYFEKKDNRHWFCISRITDPEKVVRKRAVSENPSTRNTLNVPKHCWNKHHSTFSI